MIHYGYIVDKDENIIDEVMTSVMKAPKSYTMEDTVEINCHGGVLVMQKVLEKRRDIHVIAKKILEAKEVIAQNKPVKGDEEESTTSELESAAE